MRVRASLVSVTMLAIGCGFAMGQTGSDGNEKQAQESATDAAPVGKDRSSVIRSDGWPDSASCQYLLNGKPVFVKTQITRDIAMGG